MYVIGFRMSARAQLTELDHGGAVGEAVTEDQLGSPERLERWSELLSDFRRDRMRADYLMDVTSQPRATAYLHIREPNN